MTTENQTISLRQHLIRGATGSLVIKTANMVLSLLTAVVFARVLGVEKFGIYSFYISVAGILTVPVTLFRGY